MGAPHVFVAHQGGISFGDEKALRVAHNNAILTRRYPDASDRYQDFCLRDPLKPARQSLQRARLKQLAKQVTESHASVWPLSGFKKLHIQHAASRNEAPLTLTWRHQGQKTAVNLEAQLQPLPLRLECLLPDDASRLVDDLRNLPLDELIYQQLTVCPVELREWPAALGKPYRILCLDEELLQPNAVHDWTAFAREALSFHLLWKALHKRYAAALPGANLVTEPKRKTLAAAKLSPRTLFIADVMHDAHLAEQWLALAQRIIRENLPVMLVMHSDGPWLKALLTTGSVHTLSNVQGLNLADCVLLSGCKAALSLELNLGTSWYAPELAASVGLSLYATAGPIANEAGAYSINQLTLSLSRA